MTRASEAIPELVGSWTPEQWQAIHRRGHHLLVSAAAGAGKTAVLVERIIQRLLDPVRPCDIDRLLVVTFTDAAAAQMRERIAQALHQAAADERRPERERARLRRQLVLLDRAPIDTLHGFCSWLVRRYFYRLDLDPMFRILDSEEAILLREEVMDQVFEKAYTDAAEGHSAFFRLLDAYGGRQGDVDVRRVILSLHAYIASLPDPEAWLERTLEMYRISEDAPLDMLPWTKLLLSAMARETAYAVELLARARRLAAQAGAVERAQQILANEHEFAIAVQEAVDRGEWGRLAFEFGEPLKFDRLLLKGVEDDLMKERISEARNEAKDVLRDLQKRYFTLSPQEHVRLLRETEPYVRELIRLLRAFDAAYSAAKRQRSAIDFNDLERLALTVLRLDAPDDAGSGAALAPCAEMRAYFDEVLVDEYQDINPVQDAILSLVSRPADDPEPNLFMVGDVKQSIYRFRMADPELFLERMRRYATEVPPHDAPRPPGIRIDLSTNFRSRSHIVDAVNFVFRQILTPGTGGLAYDRAAELRAGAEFPGSSVQAVELHLLERAEDRVIASDLPPDEDDTELGSLASSADQRAEIESLLSAAEREAWYTARRVRELIDQGFQVYDRDAGIMRPLQYRDIVVLLRSTRVRANAFVDAFRAFDIPVYAESGTGYFWAVEIETMLALLQIIDNPRQDIPLAAVLRAPWVGLTTHDLAAVRLAARDEDYFTAVVRSAEQRNDALGERLRAFLERLERWRSAARQTSISDLLRLIYQETQYPDYVLGMPGGEQRKANLEALLERAQRFDGFGQGDLGRFLRFVESLQEADGDQGEAPLLGEGDDVVRVMSIHKSKGLQFPVVILADCGKRFNMEDVRGRILFEGRCGLGLEWVDPDTGVAYPTLSQRAVAEALRRETIAEELRVLYVALTRAQEHLILVGSVNDIGATCARWAGAVDVSGWPLPEHVLGRAQSYLDWIGPAVMRHRDGEPLRQIAAAEGGRTFTPQDAHVAADASRWMIEVHLDAHMTVEGGRSEEPADLQHLGTAQALGRDVPAALAADLADRLEWEYPYPIATWWPAKVSVTLLAREAGSHRSDDAADDPEGRRGFVDNVEESSDIIAERFRHAALSRRLAASVAPAAKSERQRSDEIAETLRGPAWLQEEQEVPTAVARGTATHLLLDRLDLSMPEPITEQTVQRVLERLVADYVLTEAEANAVDRLAIVEFFQSSVGKRMRSAAARGSLWREWSFSLAMTIDELSDLWGGEAPAQGEKMVVQGTIDALWQEPDGRFCLVDYKTDQTHGVSDLLKRYRPQVELYVRAVEAIVGKSAEGYLVLLDKRQVIPILA